MTSLSATEIIEYFGLQPHPEGGYFAETYRSEKKLNNLPQEFTGPRSYLTSIYFLLKDKDKSHFHRLKSDEIWYFHKGTALKFYLISPEGILSETILGPDILAGEVMQVVAPAGYYMAACVVKENSYSFISCAVAPGFDFADFEMGDKKNMIREFPDHVSIIEQFTL